MQMLHSDHHVQCGPSLAMLTQNAEKSHHYGHAAMSKAAANVNVSSAISMHSSAEHSSAMPAILHG